MLKTIHHKVIAHTSSKEWVVFIHGMGGSSSLWFKQIREFRKHFNLLLIDLPGHGGNDEGLKDVSERSFVGIAQKVLHVLDANRIQGAHFVGISLGTMVIRVLQDISPSRVKSMVLGGAVERIHPPLLLVAKIAEGFKRIVPYMWLYQFVAWVLMPRAHNAEARKAFINEAVKLGQREFFCWYRILRLEINAFFTNKKLFDSTPTLYIMGSEDYMFLPIVSKRYKKFKNASLHILPKTGHVCNIENEKGFNELAIDFIHQNSSLASKEKQA